MTDTATTPVLEFTSHIAGKNAKVRVFRDRIEWERKSVLGTGGKAALALGTGGLSYFATGVTGKRDTEMIPIKSISSVTSKKGVMNTLLTFITTGNTVEMNVSHSEAAKVKDLVQTLMLNPNTPAAAPSLPVADARPAAAAPAQSDVAAELQKFASLRDQGIITDEDFDAKKRQLLGL